MCFIAAYRSGTGGSSGDVFRVLLPELDEQLSSLLKGEMAEFVPFIV